MKQIILTTLIVTVFTITWSKPKSIPLIGDKAPSFTEESTNGILKFPEDFGDSWKILFSHPLDFTAVCTSELIGLAGNQKKFEALGVKIAVISIDEIDRHRLWKEFMEKTMAENGEAMKINFPIVADHSGKASKKYGMLHLSADDKRDVRGVYIIDPNNIVQSISFYPMNVGRSIDELLRTVAALQLTQRENVLTPYNWEPGDDVLVPHKPFTEDELEENPNLKNQYYNKGEFMWYKRMEK